MDMMKAQILGKVSELEFAKICIDLGYVVSKPINDHGGYDYIIQSGHQLKRIQVRATESPNKEGRYKINCTSKKGFDFLALYLRDINIWYIIPKHVITCVTVMVRPNKSNNIKSKFDHYKDNWNIIFDI